jgi:sulfatase maturation enzyme AslB (radical SAM superfamily)
MVTDNYFKPLSLTVFSGGGCRLNCRYCYGGGFPVHDTPFTTPALLDALREVATNCLEQKIDVTMVFHGTNEPLLYHEEIKNLIQLAKELVTGTGQKLRLACTTSGVAPRYVLEWASATFDHITLSWDGPPKIQDYNRPLKKGGKTSEIVAGAAEIFRKGKGIFTVRTTVTDRACEDMTEIVCYLAKEQVKNVVLYPVYPNHRGTVLTDLIPQPGKFAKQFLRARRWGQENGIEVFYPGVRVSETHGQFCAVLQKNLAITSDDFISGCFLVTHNNTKANNRFLIGALENDGYAVNKPALLSFCEKLNRGFAQCQGCFNAAHCSKGCPSVCPVIQSFGHRFDCSIEKIIGNALLLEKEGHELSGKIIEELSAFHTNYKK